MIVYDIVNIVMRTMYPNINVYMRWLFIYRQICVSYIYPKITIQKYECKYYKIHEISVTTTNTFDHMFNSANG